MQKRGCKLVIDPCIPSDWPGFSATFTHGATRYEISVENPARVCRGIVGLELDGVALSDRSGIRLMDDGQVHQVRVVLGGV